VAIRSRTAGSSKSRKSVTDGLPSRAAEYEPWMNTELLVVFDASDGTPLASLPTSIEILHLG
jgi:hypothetical protein